MGYDYLLAGVIKCRTSILKNPATRGKIEMDVTYGIPILMILCCNYHSSTPIF
jgi:hypothetical protein